MGRQIGVSMSMSTTSTVVKIADLPYVSNYGWMRHAALSINSVNNGETTNVTLPLNAFVLYRVFTKEWCGFKN